MIDILKPKIFPSEIIAGVTKKNISNIHPNGLSLSSCKFLTDEEVDNNRKFLAKEINVKFSHMKFQKQIHGANVNIITQESNIEDSDAMITSQTGIVLNISIADCVALLIYDQNKKIIAGIHSGWRGTEKNITQKTLNLMQDNFFCNFKDLKVYISPAAQKHNYEVGWEVAKKFPGFYFEKDNGKYLLDNPGKVYSQLLEMGVLKENIEKSEICTIGNNNFHSYRRDKKDSGRMLAFIGLI
jgi:YfiH family protein